MRTVLVRKARSIEDKILAWKPKNWKDVAEIAASVYLSNVGPTNLLNGEFIRYGAWVAYKEGRQGNFSSQNEMRASLENIKPAGALVHNYVEAVRAEILSASDPANAIARKTTTETLHRHFGLTKLLTQDARPKRQTYMELAAREIGPVASKGLDVVADKFKLG